MFNKALMNKMLINNPQLQQDIYNKREFYKQQEKDKYKESYKNFILKNPHIKYNENASAYEMKKVLGLIDNFKNKQRNYLDALNNGKCRKENPIKMKEYKIEYCPMISKYGIIN